MLIEFPSTNHVRKGARKQCEKTKQYKRIVSAVIADCVQTKWKIIFFFIFV